MSQGNTDVPVQHDTVDECPFREVLERVSSKWTVQIILATANGPIRFTELEHSIEGISRRMLTLTLRRLERDGLVHRKVYPSVPPKVEYTATAIALELESAFQALADWAVRHQRSIAQARENYDQENTPAAVG